MLGVIIALACALCWSVSLILLKIAGTQVHPIILNLGKNILGLVLLVPTAFLIDGAIDPSWPRKDLSLLLVSGFVGIGIADALTLRSMNYLNATKIAILECLFAPFIWILSLLFLNESIALIQFGGAALIAASVLLVTPLRRQRLQDKAEEPQAGWGSFLMISGLFTMAIGIIMIKPVYQTIPLFWIITIRMLAGVAGSVFVLLFYRDRRLMLKTLLTSTNKPLVIASFVTSSYLAISLWIAGYKYLEATIAAILNQTSTIFTVILAVMVLGERLSQRKVWATILATAGVIIISTH